MEQYKENKGMMDNTVVPEVSATPEKSKFQEMKDAIKSKATKAIKWTAIAAACVGAVGAINHYGGNTVEGKSTNGYESVYEKTKEQSDYMKFETTVPEGKTIMKTKSNRIVDAPEIVTNVTPGQKVKVDFYDAVTFE